MLSEENICHIKMYFWFIILCGTVGSNQVNVLTVLEKKYNYYYIQSILF